MGDCLTTSVKTQQLPGEDKQGQERTQPTILLASSHSLEKQSNLQPSVPNIQVIAPQAKPQLPPREPSIDLRQSNSCEYGRSSRSGSGISDSRGGSYEPSRESGIGHTESNFVRKPEEERRSSIIPLQINPTVSYIVDADRRTYPRPSSDVNLQLVDGQVIVSRAQPISRQAAIDQSAVVVMTKLQVHPAIEQSAVLIQTRRQ